MAKADFFRVQKAGVEQIEELLTTTMILNTEFAAKIVPKLNLDHITSPHLRKICEWTIDYFTEYGKAPKTHIAEIFEVESTSLPEDKSEQIGHVLESLSDKYTDKTQNVDYIYNESIDYLERQELLIRARNTIGFAEKGMLDKARNEIRTYGGIRKDLGDDGIFITPENFHQVTSDDYDRGVMRLPGSLGKMIGSLERGWLVSLLAPMKRGKTFYLVDWAIEAYLQGLKVVFFSLEMKKKDIDKRLFTALTGKPLESGRVLIPVFDCKSNQHDTCHLEHRVGEGSLFDDDGERPTFDEAPNYIPCDECRKRKELHKYYKPDSWFVEEESEEIQWSDVDPSAGRAKFRMNNPANFRRFCPAIGTVTYSYIDEVLNDLRLTDNFIPDVIVVDYADLLTSTLKADLRHQLNEIWQFLARTAVERNCLMLTASQTNRPSMKQKTLEEDAPAEDIRKNAHVSVMIGINQSKSLNEKEKGLLRLNLLYHRFKEVSGVQCLTTQQLSISRVCIDSMLTVPGSEEYFYIGG